MHGWASVGWRDTREIGSRMSPPGPATSALEVVRISDYAAFLGLRDAWNDVASTRSVFLRHEWFDAAWQWRRLEDAARLAIHCVFRGPRLVGILPLIARDDGRSAVASSVLEYLTVPDTQLCDLIAAAPDRIEVAGALAADLIAWRSAWDRLKIPHLPEDALARGAFRTALQNRGARVCETHVGGNPYVNLDTGWDAYYATRSRSLKKANNLAANRLKKAGEVRVAWIEPDANLADDPKAGVEAALAISANSWKRSTGNSLDNPGPQAFIRRLSELAVAQRWMSLWLLWLDGRPMAMEYQLVFDGNVHALRSDFVDSGEDLSPGSHLNRHLLEQLFGRRLRRYLMGPGDNPYKKRWTEDAEPLFQFDVYSPTARGRVAGLWECRLKPVLRSIKAYIKPGEEARKP